MVASCVLVLLQQPQSADAAAVDTITWIGSSYTPARAPNSMWWGQYSSYEADIKRELAATQKYLGFKALRVFLHSQAFEIDGGASLLANMEKFLTASDAVGMKVGFVFFGDCWVQSGGNITSMCVPKKGVHNGCWMASPQDQERTSVDVFNEPHRGNDAKGKFTMALRDAGFKWA